MPVRVSVLVLLTGLGACVGTGGCIVGPHTYPRPSTDFGKSCQEVLSRPKPACLPGHREAIVERELCSVLYRRPGVLEDPRCVRQFVLPLDTNVIPRWPKASEEQRRGLLLVVSRVSLESALTASEASGAEEFRTLAQNEGLGAEFAHIRFENGPPRPPVEVP